MPVTEAEFRALLADRSEGVSIAPDTISRVHRRIELRQRRVRAGAAAAVTAAALAGGIAVPGLVSDDRPVQPAAESPTPALSSTDLTPAQYWGGGRLITGGVLLSPTADSITITFVPLTWPITVRTTCTGTWDDAVVAELISLNDRPVSGGPGCGGAVTWSGPAGSTDEALGIHLGEATTLKLTLVQPLPHGRIDGASPVAPSSRPSGALTVGIYERVPTGQ
ncbi:MAG: hypothetical protein JWM93_3118 [Frankiales bacterium]|nr:hypothetical protein [Frankiales bacterium]